MVIKVIRLGTAQPLFITPRSEDYTLFSVLRLMFECFPVQLVSVRLKQSQASAPLLVLFEDGNGLIAFTLWESLLVQGEKLVSEVKYVLLFILSLCWLFSYKSLFLSVTVSAFFDSNKVGLLPVLFEDGTGGR